VSRSAEPASAQPGRLGPEVEALQVPPADLPAAWQENLFFICWDDHADTGFLLHVQRVPSLGEQEARVVVVVDGEVASATLTGPYGPAPVGGVVLEPLDPFRAWRVAVDAPLRAGAGPLGLLTLEGPGDVPAQVDLQLRSELPVVDFAAALDEVVAEMGRHAEGPQMGRQEHYEQGGTWQGRLRLAGREVEGAGLFVRDHSWGVRSEQQAFRAFWTASCLDGGRTFANAIGILTGDSVVGIGAVADARGVRFTKEVRADFSPAPGIASYDEVEVGFGAGIDQVLRAQTIRHLPIPLPRSGPGRYDSNAMSRVEMRGEEGFGVMEWASTFSDVEAAAVGEVGAWS
jgi:hypothetical protein